MAGLVQDGLQEAFWIDFGSILGGFGEGLGRVWGAFGEDFGRVWDIFGEGSVKHLAGVFAWLVTWVLGIDGACPYAPHTPQEQDNATQNKKKQQNA